MFKKDLEWGKQDFISVVLLRSVVFFSHCLITSSFAAEAIELVNIDKPFHALQKIYSDFRVSFN